MRKTGNHEKLLISILCGNMDNNIAFNDLCNLLNDFGFSCRIKGDHFIYTKSGIEEIINIQPLSSKAKAYQVKQIREIIHKYKLGDEEDV